MPSFFVDGGCLAQKWSVATDRGKIHRKKTPSRGWHKWFRRCWTTCIGRSSRRSQTLRNSLAVTSALSSSTWPTFHSTQEDQIERLTFHSWLKLTIRRFFILPFISSDSGTKNINLLHPWPPFSRALSILRGDAVLFVEVGVMECPKSGSCNIRWIIKQPTGYMDLWIWWANSYFETCRTADKMHGVPKIWLQHKMMQLQARDLWNLMGRFGFERFAVTELLVIRTTFLSKIFVSLRSSWQAGWSQTFHCH